MNVQVEQVYRKALADMDGVLDWTKVLWEFQQIYTSETEADIMACIIALENEMELRDCMDADTCAAILEVIDPVDVRRVRDAFFTSYKELAAHLDQMTDFPFGSMEAFVRDVFSGIISDVPLKIRQYIDYDAMVLAFLQTGQYVIGRKIYYYER